MLEHCLPGPVAAGLQCGRVTGRDILTFDVINEMRYCLADPRMIESFDCDETEKIFHGEISRKLPRDIQQVARRKLMMIHAAKTVMDLKLPPKNKHEILKGKWKGWHSIRINDQWRICFLWDSGIANRAYITDYH